MNKIFKLILLLTTVLSLSTVANASMPEYSSPKNKIIVTPTQPEFTITLKSNATTGYTWSIATIDETMFKNVSHKYVAPNTKLIGAPGYEVWTFKALYPEKPFAVNQVGHVVMQYTRPWMKNDKPETVYHFTIVLKKK